MRYYSSTAQAATLISDLSAGATSMTVSGTTGFPGSHPFTLVIDPGTSAEEIVDVTASSGTTLTITRGRDGTAAQNHLTGAQVRHMVTARDLREAQEHINATSNVHGASGTLVTTTATQTLSNKTLDGSQNTFVNIPAEAVQGATGGGLPSGSITAFAGASVPDGWLLCDGSPVSRSTYSALFAVLGTTYGAGDGSTTFNLPNLSGRFTVGTGTLGYATYALGAIGGEEQVTLTTTQMPSHNHTASTSTSGEHTHGAYTRKVTQTSPDQSVVADEMNGGTLDYLETIHPAGGHFHVITINNRGSGQPHENRPPYLALNYIIKT